MWTLSMFFFEIRYSFSLGLLLYLWYGIGLIDLYLHYMITKELRKVVRLPVEIDSVTCSLSGVAVVKGIHILSPPIEEDARWELSLIATVDEVRVMFPFLISLLFFLLSNGELAIADDVAVQGIRFYVEGYRPVASNPIDSVISNPHAANSSDSRLSHDHDHAQGTAGHTSPATSSTSQHAEEVVYNVFLIGAYEKQHHKKARRGSTRRSRSRSHSHPTRLSEENRDVDEEESRDSLTRSSDGEGEGNDDGDVVREKRRCEQVVFDYGMRSLQLRENYFPTITPNHRKEESKVVQTLLTAMPSDEHHYAASMSSSSSLSATSSISSLPVATPLNANAPLSPSKQPTSPLTSTSYAILPPHPRQSFSGFFHDTASHWKHRLIEKATHIKNKVKELHDEVQESGGIYNATKQRIAHVYEKTKQSIDVTIADKINQLHVYLCGYEPLPTARMPRLICYHVAFRQLEIHLLRALPLQLRHLESKPLLVERLDFYDVGFDNLTHIPLPTPKTSENPNTTQPQSQPHSPPSKPIDSSQSNADVADSSKSLHHLNHLLARMNIPSNSHGSGDASKRSSLRSVSIRYTPGTEVNEVAVEEEDHLLHLLDLFSIDIWRSGMDAMIFKYHFERKILHKLFKSNAGRVINDFFTISNWLHKPQHSLNPEESDVSGVGIADTDQHPHHSHHHTPHHPPLHRTSFSERYTTNHQSQSSATVERSISCSGTAGRRIPSRDSGSTPFVSTSRRMVTHPML
eukprot:gene3834-4096_t